VLPQSSVGAVVDTPGIHWPSDLHTFDPIRLMQHPQAPSQSSEVVQDLLVPQRSPNSSNEGISDGDEDDISAGTIGCAVGFKLGSADGTAEGLEDGFKLGLAVGSADGVEDGLLVMSLSQSAVGTMVFA